MTFVEGHIDVDGFRIRSLVAGDGDSLVFIHGGGGLHLTPAHTALAEHYRVLALEVPGFGTSPENTRSGSYADLAATLVSAAKHAGAERFRLWGTSFGGAIALWMAIGAPDAVEALVLEAPGAILPEGGIRPASTPEEMRSRLYAHPERQPPTSPPDPQVLKKQRALLDRLGRPSREETEAALATLNVPTLVIFGTRDGVISPDLGRVYREKMPNCNYVLVFDAGHEVAADRPEAFVSLVGDFLERREAFIVSRTSSLLHP